MSAFIKKHPFISVILAAALLVALILSTVGTRNVTVAEDAAGMIYTPAASIGNRAISAVKDFFARLFNTTDVHKENAQLKERITQLEGDNALLRELQLENSRLRELTNYVEANEDYEILTARIAAKNPGYWFDSFIISAGRNQGVKTDMPVVSSSGLVGRITEVGGNWAKVLTIADVQSSVSGIVERTRDTGIVKGVVQSGGEIVCSMHYLPYESDLVPGDMILTSGLGGIFPKGLVVGSVSEVSRSDDASERTAVIRPAVDFNTLEEVMVILKVYEQVNP